MFLPAFVYSTAVYIWVPLVYAILGCMPYSCTEAALYSVPTVLGYMLVGLAVEALNDLAVAPEDLTVIQFTVQEQALLYKHICLLWYCYSYIEGSYPLT